MLIKGSLESNSIWIVDKWYLLEPYLQGMQFMIAYLEAVVARWSTYKCVHLRAIYTLV